MTAMKTSKGMPSVRILGAVLAALFAMLAAGCAQAATPSTGPVLTTPTPKSAPAPGVAAVAPMQPSASRA
jgi:hypothetical protein